MTDRGFARGRLAAQSLVAALLSVIALGSSGAWAASSDYDGFTWTTDRSEPQVWEVLPTFGGRDDVLHIQTYATNPAPFTAGFYQTEGRFTLTNNPVGASFVSADIYIPASQQTSTGGNYVNIGLWGVIGEPPANAQSYPVINFYNGAAVDPAGEPMVQTGAPTNNVGEVRVYDSGQWIVATGANAVTSTGVINYDGWNTFRINYNPGATPADGSVDVLLNGTVIQTLSCANASNTCSDFTGGPIDPDTASLYSIILNARTNGNSAYDIYWSNVMAATREEYYDAAAVAPSAIIAGAQILGTYVDRRGLDWDSQKAAWMHAVGGTTTFDDGNGSVEANIGGAQFGLDLVTLGNPSNRAGVTFGYSQQDASVTGAGSSNSKQPSIGAYLTHSDPMFYVDLLGQYRFLTYDVTSPTSEGTVNGGSADFSAEAGMHLGSGNFSLTPFAQLTYQHLMLDDTSQGGFDISFDNADALIARARLLAQAKFGGLSMFVSAGVSGDLLGAKQTTISGSEFMSTIGGTQAEFTGGFEGTLAGGLSVYASGEYDTSFDGQSTTALGRGGMRLDF